jgi:acyl-CoA thioester hydrolase
MGQPFSYPLRVRYAECDRQEVVFNAHYLTYFDVAMTELGRAAFGSYQSMMERGYDLVVAEANIRFVRSARFDDELSLEVAVTKLGNSSIVTRHRILREDELLIEGMMRHVMVDIATLRKAPLPDWVRTSLSPWVLDGDSVGSVGTQIN